MFKYRPLLWCVLGVVPPATGIAQPSPALRPIDRVQVAESGTFLLGNPTALLRAPGGNYFVIDGPERRVVELSATGRPVRTFGRRGNGPGELQAPLLLAISGDTLLSVMDMGQARVTTWDLRSGNVLGTFPLTGRVTQLQHRGGQFRIGVLEPGGTSAIRILSATGASQGFEGGRPAVFERSPPLLAAFGAVYFADDGNDVYAVFEVSNSLFHWRRGSSVVDETPIPVSTRKGLRTGLFEEMLRDPDKAGAIAYDRSMPIGLHRIGPGLLGLITLDASVGGTGFVGQYHVSVLDVARRRACVDVLVPAPPDPLPSLSMAGDTLLMVRSGEDSAGQAATWLTRYKVDVGPCQWWPLPNSTSQR